MKMDDRYQSKLHLIIATHLEMWAKLYLNISCTDSMELAPESCLPSAFKKVLTPDKNQKKLNMANSIEF